MRILCSFKFVAGIEAATEPTVAAASSLDVNAADALRAATRGLFILFYSARKDNTDFKPCRDFIAFLNFFFQFPLPHHHVSYSYCGHICCSYFSYREFSWTSSLHPS